MNDNTARRIKTGGDPRALPDYAALRDELSKLAHPARPDVNWHYAEKLCLALFEQNGVELQTAAWYTQVRTRLAGLAGLNEGLAVLEALISHQWGALWPHPVHARMEILSSLSQRLQQLMRTLPFSYQDLSQLYQAEQRLASLGAVLQRLELRHLSQLETLRTLMHNSAVRLENSDSSEPSVQPGITLPVMNHAPSQASESGIAAASIPEASPEVKWVYVAHSASPPRVLTETVPAPAVKRWPAFAAGMLCMLAVVGAGEWGWQYFYPAPVPEPVPPAPVPVIASAQALKTLEQQPAAWIQQYGFTLAASAGPEEAPALAQQWQHYLSTNALPVESLSGWHQGMAGLQALTQRLDALDERKGKYLTGSELKSMVFAITQNFRRSPPVEDYLYQLSQLPPGQALPAARKVETENYLNQVLNRYALIMQPSGRGEQPAASTP